MRLLILILLILLLLGALPTWPYSAGWGYYPSGGIGLLAVILIIVAIYIYPPLLLLAITWLYATSGPAMWAWQKLRRKPASSQGPT